MRIQKAYSANNLRQQLFDLIVSEHPNVNRLSYLTPECVNEYREKYIRNLIEEEYGQVDQLQNEVINAIKHSKILSYKIGNEIAEIPTFGERIADKIALFGGSWTFILSFFGFIMIWIGVNVYFLSQSAFDPYPFILLNLILSCLASIQAPIIMMSQNRQEHKDRIRGEHDYKINLKAELEIKLLHEKMDHLIVHQHQRLLEIQELQADYLKDIMHKLNGNKT
ncbi:MAG: DUF1003 domain-containing protein [Bacteroidetes bacterium]|nr:DUF1003 domain-containing protein [Bacteroidota bacterium]